MSGKNLMPRRLFKMLSKDYGRKDGDVSTRSRATVQLVAYLSRPDEARRVRLDLERHMM